MGKPLVDGSFVLEKYPGKGGWTYAAIPDVKPDRSAPFGWRRVKGSIDQFSFENYRLMSMGNGQLFLPVKSDIRKIIKKEAGDEVYIVLYEDDFANTILSEFLLCLEDDLTAKNQFERLTSFQQKVIIEKIAGAKNEDEKIARIAQSIDQLGQ